jgi:hypothetical protein
MWQRNAVFSVKINQNTIEVPLLFFTLVECVWKLDVHNLLNTETQVSIMELSVPNLVKDLRTWKSQIPVKIWYEAG